MPRAPMVAAALLSLLPPALPAGEAGTPMTVSATVLPFARAEQIGGDTLLTLTAADIARGGKAITAVYQVRCNTRRGYALAFSPRSAVVESAEIIIAGTPATLAGEPVTISVSDPAPRATVQVELRLRFRDGVAPGSYALPVSVTAEPI